MTAPENMRRNRSTLRFLVVVAGFAVGAGVAGCLLAVLA